MMERASDKVVSREDNESGRRRWGGVGQTERSNDLEALKRGPEKGCSGEKGRTIKWSSRLGRQFDDNCIFEVNFQLGPSRVDCRLNGKVSHEGSERKKRVGHLGGRLVERLLRKG